MCRSQNCSAEQDQDFFTLHNFFFLPQPNKNLLQEKGKSCKDIIFFTSYPIFVTLHHHRTHLGQWQKIPPHSLINQILFNFVTMRTLTVWSNAEHTQSPSLSGLQSKALMGWVDSVTFCNRLRVPATPISCLSSSCFTLCVG